MFPKARVSALKFLDDFQRSCVLWFGVQDPFFFLLLFSILGFHGPTAVAVLLLAC